jgi:hypothetical protein
MIKLRAAGCSALALCMSAAGVGAASGHPASRSSLTSHQVHRIVQMTGYRGLHSHRFEVADSFRSAGANTIVVRLDHARLGVSRAEIRRQLALAARLTADRPAFTSRIRLRGAHHKIAFHVAPANVLAPHASYVRYLIFTPRDEALTRLTKPQRVPGVQALTVIDAAHRINVTLLQGTRRHATWGPRLPAARLFAMVESLNTSSFVFLSPKTLGRLARQHINPNQALTLGREIWSNSLGFAIMSAHTGTSYAKYAHQAAHLRFAIYREHDLRYLKVSRAQYRRFAHR